MQTTINSAWLHAFRKLLIKTLLINMNRHRKTNYKRATESWRYKEGKNADYES